MAAGRLHVVHVVFSLNLGGAERVVLGLVEAGVARLGQRVSVVCLMERGKLADQVEAAGARVYALDKAPGVTLRTFGEMRRLLGEIGPVDVVHTHQLGGLIYAGPAARRAGVPVVVHTEHGKHYADRWKNRLWGRWAFRYADRFIAVSEDIADEVRGCRVVRSDKIVVVANGIDTRRFAEAGARAEVRRQFGIAEDAPVIGTVGRLNDVKCPEVLVESFARLRGELPAARLLLVGEGPMRSELEALASRLGVRDAVVFAGYQSEPQRFYSALDVFALTSRTEGMPLSVLEAWAAGVPVVASRVGGLPGMITDGATGMLVDVGDVGGFAGAFSRVLDDTAAAAKMRARASALVMERFDTGAMAREYLRQYTQLLAGTGGGMAVAGEAG